MDIRAQLKLGEETCIALGIPPRIEYLVSRDEGKSYTYAAARRHEAEHFLEVEFPHFKGEGYRVVETLIYPPVSSDMSAAWAHVKEPLRQRGWLVRVQETPDDWPMLAGSGWGAAEEKPLRECACCILYPSPRQGGRARTITEMGDTAAEALCKAAIKALHLEAI